MNNGKCPHCYGVKSNEDYCEMCGMNTSKAYKSQNKVINGIFMFNKASNIILVILLTIAVVTFIFSDFVNIPESTSRILSIISALIFGCVMLWIGITVIIMGIKMSNLLKNGIEVHGKIVDYNNQNKVNVPIIEYELKNRKYRTVSTIGINASHKIGDDVVLKYNAENPYESMAVGNLKNFKMLITIGILFIVFTVIFIIAEFIF